LTLKRRRELTDELARVDAKIAAVRKKTKKADCGLSSKQAQSFLDTRASFFSEFAPNVFGGKPGGFTPGSTSTRTQGGKVVHVHQNFGPFHQIPAELHLFARQARLAAAAVMD
jgi:hypothetical protein